MLSDNHYKLEVCICQHQIEKKYKKFEKLKFLTDIKGQSTIENEKRISINKNLYIILKKNI